MKSLFACAIVGLVLPHVDAGVVVTDSPEGYPRATAILGLDVSGTTYDVTFHHGESYNSVFSSSTPAFLGNEPGADAARNAILMALNAETIVPSVNATAAIGTEFTSFWVPYSAGGDASGGTNSAPNAQNYDAVSGFLIVDTPDSTITIATFDAASVPEPSTIAFLAILSTWCVLRYIRSPQRLPTSAESI